MGSGDRQYFAARASLRSSKRNGNCRQRASDGIFLAACRDKRRRCHRLYRYRDRRHKSIHGHRHDQPDYGYESYKRDLIFDNSYRDKRVRHKSGVGASCVRDSGHGSFGAPERVRGSGRQPNNCELFTSRFERRKPRDRLYSHDIACKYERRFDLYGNIRSNNDLEPDERDHVYSHGHSDE